MQKVIDECERRDDPALAKVLALLWRFAAEAARAEAAGFAREAAASASGGRLPQILDFSPVNDDRAGAEADRGLRLASGRPAPPELSAPPADSSEDKAPRVELPPELVARLDDAA